MALPKKAFVRLPILIASFLFLALLTNQNSSFAAAPSNTCEYDKFGDDCFLKSFGCTTGKICPENYGPSCVTGPIPCVTPAPRPTVPSRNSEGCPISVPGEGIKTGIGCIPFESAAFARRMVQILVGITGGIVLILLIVGAAQFVSSSGDPDTIEEAKSKITAAVSGFFLIVLSVLVLKVIGIDILGLPGFNPLPGGGVQITPAP